MCLVRVSIDSQREAHPEIKDVVDVRVEGACVRVTTLFGEKFCYEGLSISHIDLNANVVHLTGGLEHERS